jgi:hypothetical protein
VPSRKDGREQLLDHLILTNNHFLQLFLHQQAVLGKFLQDAIERLGLGCSRHGGWFLPRWLFGGLAGAGRPFSLVSAGGGLPGKLFSNWPLWRTPIPFQRAVLARPLMA